MTAHSFSSENAPLGIFDSGLGGLTIARQLVAQLPAESLVYVGDTQRCPYGPQPRDIIQGYVIEICDFLQQQGVKLIVIACNTATAAALDLAREYCDVPVGTISSGAYEQALLRHNKDLQVLSQATPEFISIVEQGLALQDEQGLRLPARFFELAHRYLDPLVAAGIDTLMLGCTHYPILAPALREIVGNPVTLVSSAEETVHEVTTLLERAGTAASSRHRASAHYYTTGDPERFRDLGSRIMGTELEIVSSVVF